MIWEAEVKELGEVCSFQRGLTYAKGDEVDLSEKVVLRANNISMATNALDFAELKYIKDSIAIPESKLVRRDTLMICTASGSKSHLGKVAYVDDDYGYAFGGFMGLLVPEREVRGRYLYYAMLSDDYKEFIDGLSDGVNINNLKWDDLKSFTLPIPPLPEQQRIVGKLDAAFAALTEAQAHVERNRANARELFESYLNGVFEGKGDGWVEKTLGELGKVSMCKRIMKNETSRTGDIPFYKIGTFGKAPDAFIPKEIYQEFKKKYPYPKKGDVLISASGTIGRGVVYDGKPAYFQDSNIVWIDNDEGQVLNEYLYQFYRVCDWKPSKGATISRLYNDDLRRIKIAFPDAREQRKLVEHMVELDEQTQTLEATYQQKLLELAVLKKAILGAAFRGEL